MQVSLQGLFLSCLLMGYAYCTEECVDSDGGPYLGTRQVTADGLLCLNWLHVQKTSTSPLLTAAEDHSYCRNPDGEVGPWCYATGKKGFPEKRLCGIPPCQAPDTPNPTTKLDVSPGNDVGDEQVFEPADVLPSRSESAAVQPVIGISQRVRVNPKEKKDLGTLGYVLGVLMMVIIIAIGSGIVVGYIYKRGRDLKKQHEQTVYEREMQRITLPLSAFSNPTCEIVDENTIVVHASQTPVEDGVQEGDAPLMGQAGTPGA